VFRLRKESCVSSKLGRGATGIIDRLVVVLLASFGMGETPWSPATFGGPSFCVGRSGCDTRSLRRGWFGHQGTEPLPERVPDEFWNVRHVGDRDADEVDRKVDR
jgi:hypothetical protein